MSHHLRLTGAVCTVLGPQARDIEAASAHMPAVAQHNCEVVLDRGAGRWGCRVSAESPLKVRRRFFSQVSEMMIPLGRRESVEADWPPCRQ